MTVVDDLKFITRYDIFPVIAGEYTLRTAIERYYEADGCATTDDPAQGY